MFVDQSTVQFLAPEILVIIAASVVLVAGAFLANREVWLCVSLGALTLAGSLICMAGFEDRTIGPATFASPVAQDGLAQVGRILAIVVGMLLIGAMSRLLSKDLGSEQLGCALLAVAGVMLACSAQELVLAFLSLELVSIPTYVLLFLGRKDRESAEATAKYFFLSIFSSALLLYGFSFLYGISGGTSFGDIRNAFNFEKPSNWSVALGVLAFVLTLAGLGFKMTVAPFHFYAPDVYQGASSDSAALLAVAPKIAGAFVVLRLFVGCMPSASTFGWQIMFAMSILTMTLGNVSALWQTNIRRMLAFSSIAHGGYMLMGVAVALGTTAFSSKDIGGAGAVVAYTIAYSFASLGSFAILTHLSTPKRPLNGVEELSGLAKTHPLAATALSICMFSFAGIPPLAGFLGKLGLFGGSVALASGNPNVLGIPFGILAVAGALNAAIGAAYYLRVIGTMWFAPQGRHEVASVGPYGALASGIASALLTLTFGIAPTLLFSGAGIASRSIERLAAKNPTSKIATAERTSLELAPSEAIRSKH